MIDRSFNFRFFPYEFPPLALVLILAWSIFWKGKALWRAARRGERNWFIALLLVNSLGVLEIIYLNFLARDDNGKTG